MSEHPKLAVKSYLQPFRSAVERTVKFGARLMSPRPKPAMFVECSAPFWKTVAAELERSSGFVPVYWTGLTYYEPGLRERYPDLVFHDCVRAKFGDGGLDPAELPRVPVSVDTVAVWRSEAQTFYDMLNRFDFCKDFSFAERRRHFRRVLGYWSAVLDRFQPELVVFPNPPHVGYDYVIYCLCHRRGIATAMWDETAIADRYKFILPMKRFEDGDAVLRRRYRENLDAGRALDLSPNVRRYLDTVRADYEAAKPVNEVKVAEDSKARETEAFRENDRKYLEAVCNRDLQVARGFAPPSRDWLTSCWKQFGTPFEKSFNEPFSWTEFEFAARWWWKETAKRRAYYDSLATPFEPGGPYVYVSLAGQPERTSNPQGGVFTDQYLLVEVLSRAVPEGWTVYVKDHPNQFNPVFHGHTCRDQDFYEDVKALPNVRFVGLGEVPFRLIDGARAVATIAGTTGWEAVVRGVPALIFGAAWYRDCEGVFYTPSVEACRDALRKIVDGYRVDPRKVDLYAATLQNVAVEGLSDPLPSEWTDLTEEENGKRLAESIRRLLAPPTSAARDAGPTRDERRSASA